MDWNAIIITIVAPVLRCGFGWGAKALASMSDGGEKITKFELAQLGSTVIRVGFIATVAYLGINATGIDVPALATASGAIVFDMLLNAFKVKKPEVKKAVVKKKK